MKNLTIGIRKLAAALLVASLSAALSAGQSATSRPESPSRPSLSEADARAVAALMHDLYGARP